MTNFSVFARTVFAGVRRSKDVLELPRPVAHFSTSKSSRSVKSSSLYPEDTTKIPLQRCLLVSKVTRYEYERNRHKNHSDAELETLLRNRGTDYDMLISLHHLQKAFEMDVARTLMDMGLDVKLASRLSYTDELIKWCDVVIPCGGDGTFLLAASKVRDVNKPVIGLNSAPNRSVGRLCLPKWCSKDIRGAIQCLKEGRFRWMHRTRIRTTITCDARNEHHIAPVDMHTSQLSRYAAISQSYETAEHVPPPEYLTTLREPVIRANLAVKQIPFLALNEVFIGESVSARVSHLQLQVDEGLETHTKSSGLCVTTGTGSTSWHLSINCLRTQSVQELMRILAQDFKMPVEVTAERARIVTEKYNNTLVFPPDSSRLGYSVRELIASEEWPAPSGPRARDFANTVRVKSHCVDAGLVIDGGVSFPFNDGTEAFLQILPEDCLRTVVIDD